MSISATTVGPDQKPKIQYATPTTGTTVTIADATVDIRLIVNPSGTLLALTIVMPVAPYNGQAITLCSSQIVTGLTMTAGGTIQGALTAIASINTFASWVYYSANNSWYREG